MSAHDPALSSLSKAFFETRQTELRHVKPRPVSEVRKARAAGRIRGKSETRRSLAGFGAPHKGGKKKREKMLAGLKESAARKLASDSGDFAWELPNETIPPSNPGNGTV